MESTVAIITQSIKQPDGEFKKFIHSVWSSHDGLTAKEHARAELKSIADKNNKDEEHLKNWRAKQPIGQADDLSVQYLAEGSQHWECKVFYSITDKELNKV